MRISKMDGTLLRQEHSLGMVDRQISVASSVVKCKLKENVKSGTLGTQFIFELSRVYELQPGLCFVRKTQWRKGWNEMPAPGCPI